MKQVIAMHGWCGDSSTWHAWEQQFQTHGWLWQSGERGYGGRIPISPNWLRTSKPKGKERRTIIAHSLGPHLLESGILEIATDIILLCSFSQFLPRGPSNPAMETALIGMQKHLGTDNETRMLEAFLTKAYKPAPLMNLTSGPLLEGISINGRQRLKEDLKLLQGLKQLPKGFPSKARVLVIQGMQDEIVVPKTRAVLLADLQTHLIDAPSQIKLPKAGHALIDPALISLVREWLESSP